MVVGLAGALYFAHLLQRSILRPIQSLTAFARELGSLLSGGPAPFLAAYLVAISGSWWPVACYAVLLSALTAIAIWCGPETYEESITVDNTADGAIHAAAVPMQA